jgi:hypothetical protein
MRAELPAQVLAGDELTEAGVERGDVVVLEVDLDEGLPVVVALVQLDAVERVAGEVELVRGADAGELGGDVAARRGPARPFEQHAVPGLQRELLQVAAGILGEVGRPDQLAAQAVGPAVQRADDVAARVAAAAQHDRLAVTADVRQQADALRRVHQGATLPFLGQGVEVAHFRNGQLMADVTRGAGEEHGHLAFEELRIEVASDRKLGLTAGERFAGDARVGHGPEILLERGRRRKKTSARRPAGAGGQQGQGVYPAVSRDLGHGLVQTGAGPKVGPARLTTIESFPR